MTLLVDLNYFLHMYVSANHCMPGHVLDPRSMCTYQERIVRGDLGQQYVRPSRPACYSEPNQTTHEVDHVGVLEVSGGFLSLATLSRSPMFGIPSRCPRGERI